MPPAPRSGSAVFMRVSGAGVRGLERVRDLAYRAYARTVLLDGVGHPFVATVAGDGLLVSARDVDLPEGFEQAPEPKRIALERERPPSERDVLRFDFYAMPVRR